ncbi:alpha/beta hydrolase [Dolosicoccus paucivorans]|uniref:Esterase n=1 Tax=Dolosicoccus paucivorans TaxID=84521 RepID=A0A2N6SM91_9LACT|nr:alpha/beta hydrolase-fold protein [Dolosicoccus paucivorans]PMB83670.1 esterase [Dolosicoccus paucivorans]PMC58183.1 esterase [Dolosicoccus paucivorans]
MKHEDYYYLKLKKHELSVPHSRHKRRIRVLLPKDYKEETAHYPVVYFHDGQNVFHSSESFSGHSWKTIPMIKRNPGLPKVILVGIDNAGSERINEYTPWPITDSPLPPDINLGGHGSDYAAFVMEVVKPFVDSHYRTKPEKKYTAMIGSSLGGNITAFMGLRYQDQIGGLGVFSLANWITQRPFDEYMDQIDLNPDQKVYIQVGTQEGDDTDRQLMYGNMKQAYIDTTLSYAKRLVQRGLPIENIELNIFADEYHTEEAWARHLIKCFRFLSQDW